MRKSYDKQQKQQNAKDLMGQVGKDKYLEEAIKKRELDDMNNKIKQYHDGEQAAKIGELEKKA